MKKKIILALFILVSLSSWAKNYDYKGSQDRAYWCELLCKMAKPVLEPMSRGQLQAEMLVEVSPLWDGRKEMRDSALKAYANAVDPESKDYLLWRKEGQTLVDAAYVAESFIRGYERLWVPLDQVTKDRYIKEFQQLRRVDPPYSNWILFSATVESFLRKVGAQSDSYRITSALRKIDEWYVGDGWYADGQHFAFDYYNSYVIQPMYLECLGIMTDFGKKGIWNLCRKEHYGVALKRMQKHAIILERLISPEGTLPVFGRSIPYRSGALQSLAWIALNKQLPNPLSAAQVRCGISAVLRKMFANKDNFNKKGYLTIGYMGKQPSTANDYTNNGSLYMASLAFLPLGLPANDPFWTDAPEDWTSKKAWSGQDFPQDHSWK